MKLLLASGGITNESIRNALVDLLGKPISAANALLIPTAVHAIPNSPRIMPNVIKGAISDSLGDLGWKSIAVLELTALTTLKREVWLKSVEDADALLVNGGDCQYLVGWMQLSGFADLLPDLLEKIVYVGQSAGSMIMSSHGTTYNWHTLPADTQKCFGHLDFAILPHLDNPMFPSNSLTNLKLEASKLSMSSYAIDDQTALKVVDGKIEVISEGHWEFFNRCSRAMNKFE